MCYDNKKVKSPYTWVVSPLTQLKVANQQKCIRLKTAHIFICEKYAYSLNNMGTQTSQIFKLIYSLRAMEFTYLCFRPIPLFLYFA